MRIVGIIQARLGSERLPRKVLAPLDGATVLEHVLARCRRASGIDKWVLAVPEADRELIDFARTHGVAAFAGDESDVLGRFVGALERHRADAIVRITADCPLVDTDLISEAVVRWTACSCDYLSLEEYPRGTGDIEVASADALRRAHAECTDRRHREHVTMHLYEEAAGYRVVRDLAPPGLRRPDLRACVDELADLEVVRLLVAAAAGRGDGLDVGAVVRLLDSHPEWRRINSAVPQRS